MDLSSGRIGSLCGPRVAFSLAPIAGIPTSSATLPANAEPDGSFRIVLPQGERQISVVAGTIRPGYKLASLTYGTTNLLIDLKKRQLQNEDKLNYELIIGARKFKCTTIPISRKDFGIVGAICINVDVNYLTDEVVNNKERIEAFFKNFCRMDMQLDENILSKDEYTKALKGKRHFKDDAF